MIKKSDGIKKPTASGSEVHDSRKVIFTNRFILRPLQLGDVSERYANWLIDPTSNKYITARLSIDDLRKYVKERITKHDILFLGIFDKLSGLHIGNIKYEPINSNLAYAVMGILIGEPEWRGKGVAHEVISSTAYWLRKNRNVHQIILGVSRYNLAAIKAYQKVGFVEEFTKHISTVDTDSMTMVFNIKPYPKNL